MKNLINIGLSKKKKKKMQKIFLKYLEIENAILFGSRAKGNFRNNSDIDIALNGDISLTIRNKIFNDLEELNLPFEIDLIIFNKIDNPELIRHIERVGISFYTRESYF
jgi:predicted nucleotidyltransferase